MDKPLIMDAKNYDPNLSELRRIAVRGIIFKNDRLLMIRSDFGEVKFPGGGQEPGESDMDTLIRETVEETGYRVIPESIRPFGEVEEKRLSVHEPMIWHMVSRYYFCEVEDTQGECHYTENEKKHGFQQIWITLDEAIRTNEEMLHAEGVKPWNQRECSVLKLLREHLDH